MKDLFKKMVLLICLVFLSAQCINNGNSLYQTENGVIEHINNNSNLSQFGTTDTVSPAQLDSICKADTLPQLGEWVAHTFIDFETGKEITKYTYFKEYGFTANVIYIVTYDYENFIIEKRFVK